MIEIDHEAAARRAEAEARAQGLPPQIEDEAILARIAAIMRQAEPPVEKPKKRRRRAA